MIDRDTRLFVAGQVSALIRRWAPGGNRFAVTSRNIGYREASLAGNLPHVTVVDFGPREIAVFVHQWCQSYEQAAAGTDSFVATQKAATAEAALLADIRGNASVERLAASPLLLTMLAVLRQQVGKLPDRRILLYERYTDTLIDNWHRFRSDGARSGCADRLDPQKVVDYLIPLALWLHQHTPSGTARRQDLTTVLREIILKSAGHDPTTASVEMKGKAEQTAKRFLDEMRQFAGILVERGRDAFGFLHLTFQEYFCGRALARLDLEEGWRTMRPLLHDPRWREPILLCAGRLGVRENRQDWVNALGMRMLTAQSPHEAILHRDLFLTAALAADDVGLSASFQDDLATRLAAMVHSPVPTVRDTALAGLVQLYRLHCPAAENFLVQFLSDDQGWIPTLSAIGKGLDADAARPLHPYIIAKLDDGDSYVRQAAVQALAPLVPIDPALRSHFAALLDDVKFRVQGAAVQALAPLFPIDPTLRSRLTALLNGADSYVREAVVQALASLMAMPGGPPPELQLRLHALLDYTRGTDSWSERLQACEILLNGDDHALSQRAIDLTLVALDYAIPPSGYSDFYTSRRVREQAARILGQLLYQGEKIFTRLARLLAEDTEADVRDAAYRALVRLAAAPARMDSGSE